MKLELKNGALVLHVKVVPNSSRTQFAGTLGDALKIKVAQPPEDGRANRAVESLIADALQLPPSHVHVAAGHSNPRKTIQITGITLELAQQRLDLAANS